MKKTVINENNREITYNPFDLFFNKKIVNGQFVTVGYIKDALEESPKVTGTKTNIAENDEQLQEYLDQYANTMWASDFAGIILEPEYKAALEGKRKQCKFEIEGNIIRIQRFTYQWRDPKNLAKNYDKEAEELLQARAKYGFGEGYADDELDMDVDDWYDDEDWRRKPQYQGTGVRTRGLKRNTSSGYRFPTPAPGLYSYSGKDPEKQDRMAIRNMLDPRQNGTDPVAKKKSGYKNVYYYVSPDGTMEEMPLEVVNFLRYAYKGVRNVKATQQEQMAEDEKEYNEVIKAIQDKYASKQQPTDLLFDNILYITASPIGWNEKARVNGKATKGTPMIFVNNRAIYKEFPYLKARNLNKVIGAFCSTVDINKIERVTEKKNNMYKHILNELKSRKLYTTNMKRTINEGLFNKKSEGTKALEQKLKEFANGLKERCKELSADEVEYLFDIFESLVTLIEGNNAKTPKDIAEYLYNYRLSEPKHVKVLETIRKKFRGESAEEESKEKNESYRRIKNRRARRLNESSIELTLLVRRAIKELKAMGYLEAEGDRIPTADIADVLTTGGVVTANDFDYVFDELNRVLEDNYDACIIID